MRIFISAAVFCLFLSVNLNAFNIDPTSVGLKLEKKESKEVLFRIKNLYPVAINIEVSSKDSGAVVNIRPKKLKLSKGGYTYIKAKVAIPEKADNAVKDELTFNISAANRKDKKYDKTVIVPLSIEMKEKPAVQEKESK